MWLIACFIFACSLSAAGQQRRARPSGTTNPQSSATPTSSISQQDFDKLVADADAAREGDRVDDAIALYRKGVGFRPQWAEGWWYLATLYYDHNNFAEAARAFREAAKLEPKAGAPWAMLGLCEFQLEHYDDAYTHIEQGRQLGLGDNQELTRVMRYHEGLIELLKGEYELSLQTLGTLSYEGLNSDELIIALGLSALRIGTLPKQIDINYHDREVIRRVGLAEHFNAQHNLGDATREYELAVKDYPTYPNVQYAYGRFLLSNRDNDGALAAFLREIKTSPRHALARIQAAYIYLQNKDAASGVPLAEEAVKIYPRLPLGHYVLGRLLFDAGQNARAIEELELTERMVPNEAKIYFALTRAYAKANRKADSERAREMFTKLNKQAEEANQNGTANSSALPDDNPDASKSSQP